MSRTLIGRAVLALAVLAAALPAQAADNGLTPLRAGFLVNFAKLASWPDNRFDSTTTPLRLCIVAETPSFEAIRSLVSGKAVGSRNLEAVSISDARSARTSGCHLAYLGPEKQARYAELVPLLAASGALVVDEGSRFTWPDGMIRLFVEDGRMRFEINLDAIEKAGLKIDPRLIRLARVATR